MGISRITGIADVFAWARKMRDMVVPNVSSAGDDAKRLRDTSMEIQKINQETDYIRKTGNPPPPRYILGPNGDVKKIR